MYQRIGAVAYKANLDNTIALLNHIHNPQKVFRSVHIAGTNGKGSFSYNLASILEEAGYTVGLYTSPHLKTFRERIRINGDFISRKFIVDFVEKNMDFFKELRPSFFEMTVAMAFQYFAERNIDIAVVEVGMGGRLDSTNVIVPELSVITNIGYDHTQFLGKTLPEIAGEKAGIIKKNVPVIIGETHPETKDVFKQMAERQKSPIVFADQMFSVRHVKRKNGQRSFSMSFDMYKNDEAYAKNITSDLIGLYQEKNFVTVAAAYDFLAAKMNLPFSSFKNGIRKCILNTGFNGRWQLLQHHPLCIADIAHNEAGIGMVCEQLKHTSYKKLHFVLGVVNDKDINAILALLPKNAIYYFCKAKVPRGLKASVLKHKAKDYRLQGRCYRTVKQAFLSAKNQAGKRDLIFVGGSAFTVAEVV